MAAADRGSRLDAGPNRGRHSWDFLRSLLLAARWTVELAQMAFVKSGIVGVPLLVACPSHARAPGTFVEASAQVF